MSKTMAATMNQPALMKYMSQAAADSAGFILLARAMAMKPQMPLANVNKAGTTAILLTTFRPPGRVNDWRIIALGYLVSTRSTRVGSNVGPVFTRPRNTLSR